MRIEKGGTYLRRALTGGLTGGVLIRKGDLFQLGGGGH